MLELVQVVDQVIRCIVPADAQVASVQDLAQFVADQVNDRLEIQLRRQSLLDRVDNGKLAVRLLQFCGAFSNLLFQGS